MPAMSKESAKEFLQRTQPDAWEGAYKAAVRLAQEMAPLSWEQRAALFNDVLGIIAEKTIGDRRRPIGEYSSSDERERASRFVASASGVLAGLLLELGHAHGEDVKECATSPYCALFLASCPIDTLADTGVAYFKSPGGAAKLELLLDRFPNFEALAVADVFDRSALVLRKLPKLH
jgi:hypothetical protein